MSQLFTWGGPRTGVSALASFLPKNMKSSVLICNYESTFQICLHHLCKCSTFLLFLISFYYLFILRYNIVLVLPYINMNPPRVYTCSQSWTPLSPPSPYHPSGSSQCTSPKHPVSCIEPRLAIHFLYDIIHVSMPFSQTIPPSPSPIESKRLFYTSVSLLLSCIQGYRYHLTKFHIHALVYSHIGLIMFFFFSPGVLLFFHLEHFSVSEFVSMYQGKQLVLTQYWGSGLV